MPVKDFQGTLPETLGYSLASVLSVKSSVLNFSMTTWRVLISLFSTI